MVLSNALIARAANNKICKAFGVRLVTDPSVVQLAQNGGFDAILIDLEHSTVSIENASQHCATALRIGITPIVRVPYQCGNGMVQRVLDGGAMGVVFPHIHNVADAKATVSISKYPPKGVRSMTGQLPLFGLRPTAVEQIINDTNSLGSSVILMIETRDSVENVDAIAAIDGVDMLLIGSNDLAIELGVPGQFSSKEYRTVLEANVRPINKVAISVHPWELSTNNIHLLYGNSQKLFDRKILLSLTTAIRPDMMVAALS
ncbi:hpcH/HpaI aldolase [Colletotrichum asianum]|uniref:HpcH/HpaI aldolase n=1 Tax=Colletotrichum asianum TaxID=702518 RepID=A0A8H3W0M5_9PEZI|nr:hpcH/HpaI aldolase [Colletotrichum asianum]